MDLTGFKATFSATQPPEGLPVALQALWKAYKDDWTGAHALVENDPGEYAAWVHAYLHRVEGDEWNAGYWYRRAGQAIPQQSLEEEWKTITEQLLAVYNK